MDLGRRKAIHDAMVQLSDGDRAALGVLVDELWPVILSFAKRGAGGGADAEDVAQEIFYKICARISEFDRTRDGLSWAFGIASYEVLTDRRRARRRREVFDEASLAVQVDGAASQEEQLLAAEMAAAFQLAVGSLAEDDRVSLGLRSGAPEAAGPAFRKRKQRALERLRRMWRQVYGEP